MVGLDYDAAEFCFVGKATNAAHEADMGAPGLSRIGIHCVKATANADVAELEEAASLVRRLLCTLSAEVARVAQIEGLASAADRTRLRWFFHSAVSTGGGGHDTQNGL